VLGLDLATVVTYAIILLISLPAHELAHAWVANAFGDPTPRAQGRLTPNPLAHLDPLGSLLLIVAGFGWARPVQVDAYALRRRSPAALMLVSLAGPLTNVMLASLAVIPFRISLVPLDFTVSSSFPSLGQFLAVFVLTNFVLAIFNLIPVAPLDGEEVLAFLLPPEGRQTLARLRPYGPYVLLGLILLGRIGSFDPLGAVVFRPAEWLARHLIGL